MAETENAQEMTETNDQNTKSENAEDDKTGALEEDYEDTKLYMEMIRNNIVLRMKLLEMETDIAVLQHQTDEEKQNFPPEFYTEPSPGLVKRTKSDVMYHAKHALEYFDNRHVDKAYECIDASEKLFQGVIPNILLPKVKVAKQSNETETQEEKEVKIKFSQHRSELTVKGNKEDLLKCVSIGNKALQEGNLVKAKRFLLKAERIHPSPMAKELLEKVAEIEKNALEDKDKDTVSENKTNLANMKLDDKKQIVQDTDRLEENKAQAQKCFEIANEAYKIGDLDKTERFLLKAKKFDANTDIDERLFRVTAEIAEKEKKKTKNNRESVYVGGLHASNKREEQDIDKALTFVRKAEDAKREKKFGNAKQLLNAAQALWPDLNTFDKLMLEIEKAEARQKLENVKSFERSPKSDVKRTNEGNNKKRELGNEQKTDDTAGYDTVLNSLLSDANAALSAKDYDTCKKIIDGIDNVGPNKQTYDLRVKLEAAQIVKNMNGRESDKRQPNHVNNKAESEGYADAAELALNEGRLADARELAQVACNFDNSVRTKTLITKIQDKISTSQISRTNTTNKNEMSLKHMQVLTNALNNALKADDYYKAEVIFRIATKIIPSSEDIDNVFEAHYWHLSGEQKERKARQLLEMGEFSAKAEEYNMANFFNMIAQKLRPEVQTNFFENIENQATGEGDIVKLRETIESAIALNDYDAAEILLLVAKRFYPCYFKVKYFLEYDVCHKYSKSEKRILANEFYTKADKAFKNGKLVIAEFYALLTLHCHQESSRAKTLMEKIERVQNESNSDTSKSTLRSTNDYNPAESESMTSKRTYSAVAENVRGNRETDHGGKMSFANVVSKSTKKDTITTKADIPLILDRKNYTETTLMTKTPTNSKPSRGNQTYNPTGSRPDQPSGHGKNRNSAATSNYGLATKDNNAAINTTQVSESPSESDEMAPKNNKYEAKHTDMSSTNDFKITPSISNETEDMITELDNNVSQAKKCIELAQKAISNNDLEKAERLLLKSERFYHTAEAQYLLQQVHDAIQSETKGNETDDQDTETAVDAECWSEDTTLDNKMRAENYIKMAIKKVATREYDVAIMCLIKSDCLYNSKHAKELLEKVRSKKITQQREKSWLSSISSKLSSTQTINRKSESQKYLKAAKDCYYKGDLNNARSLALLSICWKYSREAHEIIDSAHSALRIKKYNKFRSSLRNRYANNNDYETQSQSEEFLRRLKSDKYIEIAERFIQIANYKEAEEYLERARKNYKSDYTGKLLNEFRTEKTSCVIC